MKRNCILYEVLVETEDTFDSKNNNRKSDYKSRLRYLNMYETMITTNCLLLTLKEKWNMGLVRHRSSHFQFTLNLQI